MKMTNSIGPLPWGIPLLKYDGPSRKFTIYGHPLFATREKMLDPVQEVAAYSIGS